MQYDMDDPEQEARSGLANLREVIQWAREKDARKEEKRLGEFQIRNSGLNSIAQVLQAAALYGGEVDISPDKMKELTGGLISMRPGTKGTKAKQMETDLAREGMKIAGASSLQDKKAQQEMDLELVKQKNALDVIKEKAAAGDREETFKAVMNWVNEFGSTGGAGDVEAAKQAVAGAKGESTGKEKPLGEDIGGTEAPGILKMFGVGGKSITRKDLIDTLGSDKSAERAEEAYRRMGAVIEKSPDKKKKYEKLFFQEFPALRGKISF